MTTILGRTVVVEPEPDPELLALRAYRTDVLRLRSEPGHVTKAELDTVERAYQERTRT